MTGHRFYLTGLNPEDNIVPINQMATFGFGRYGDGSGPVWVDQLYTFVGGTAQLRIWRHELARRGPRLQFRRDGCGHPRIHLRDCRRRHDSAVGQY